MFEDSELDDDSRFRSTQSLLFQTGYAFSERLSVNALFTYVHQFRKISQFNNENITETSGIGDAVILGSYRWRDLIGHNNDFLIFAGPKLPIGETDKTNEDGRLIVADMQPGTGAWDLFSGAGFLQQISLRPSATYYFRFLHRLTGINNRYLGRQQYRFGNEWQIFTGLTDQFAFGSSIIEGSIGLNFRHAAGDQINGTILANTGGDFLYALASAGISIRPKIQFTFGGQLPVYSKPKGTQLVPSYRLNVGLIINISLKNDDSINLNINEQ